MRSIQSYLDVSTPPEEHYEFQQGSCQWIEDRDDFQTWRDSEVAFDKDESYVPSVYWVHAGPGAGKTMLAAHVVSLLQESQMQCAGYHFHVGTKATTSLGVFLRSIAFDMASSNAVIRDAMEKLCEYGATFGLDDARAIWSTVFKAVIFQVRQKRPWGPVFVLAAAEQGAVRADIYSHADKLCSCQYAPPSTGSLMRWTSALEIPSSFLCSREPNLNFLCESLSQVESFRECRR